MSLFAALFYFLNAFFRFFKTNLLHPGGEDLEMTFFNTGILDASLPVIANVLWDVVI